MHRTRILVVDDYAPNAAGMERLLTDAGHTVRVAHSGEDALKIVAEVRIDLALVDVVMPGMSGIQLCRELKALPQTRLTPIILVTGDQDRSKRLEGIEAGADDFLGKPVDVAELRTRVQSLLRVKRLTDELESTEAIMTMLGQIVEARDPHTEGHCERLAHYATSFGIELGLGEPALKTLNSGAYLHDLGKIAVPDRVLLKPGPLTPEEHALMRRHTIVGDNLCGTVRSLADVRSIVRSHHERADGRGYPDGLAGDAIPLPAQIVGVVDVFDALTTDRPYRPAMTTEAAYERMLLEASGGWRAPEMVSRFVEMHRATRTRTLHQVRRHAIRVGVSAARAVPAARRWPGARTGS